MGKLRLSQNILIAQSAGSGTDAPGHWRSSALTPLRKPSGRAARSRSHVHPLRRLARIMGSAERARLQRLIGGRVGHSSDADLLGLRIREDVAGEIDGAVVRKGLDRGVVDHEIESEPSIRV